MPSGPLRLCGGLYHVERQPSVAQHPQVPFPRLGQRGRAVARMPADYHAARPPRMPRLALLRVRPPVWQPGSAHAFQ